MLCIIKLSSSTSTGNIPGTLARSYWSNINVSNCTIGRGWLSNSFFGIADSISLSDTNNFNCIISIGLLGILYTSGTANVVLLSAGALHSTIGIG